MVKTLKAGSYKFVMRDKSNFHGFSLDGPHGFAKDFTRIPFVGTKTFVVKLKDFDTSNYTAKGRAKATEK